MLKSKLSLVILGILSLGLSVATSVFASGHIKPVYAAYNGSQLGVTVRDLKLNQLSFFNTGISTNVAIAAGPNHDVYLASANKLYNFDAAGHLKKVMTFPDPRINYTSVAVRGDKVYASYTGSQQGVTIRTLKLDQLAFFGTGINASGIAVGAHNDIYLSAGNGLYRYDTSGKLITKMIFPDPRINYTDVTVAMSGDKVYASYTGSQQGVTIRDLNLAQLSFFGTGLNAGGITAGPNSDMYLTAGNGIYNYATSGMLINKMIFPDPRINYTDVSY